MAHIHYCTRCNIVFQDEKIAAAHNTRMHGEATNLTAPSREIDEQVAVATGKWQWILTCGVWVLVRKSIDLYFHQVVKEGPPPPGAKVDWRDGHTFFYDSSKPPAYPKSPSYSEDVASRVGMEAYLERFGNWTLCSNSGIPGASLYTANLEPFGKTSNTLYEGHGATPNLALCSLILSPRFTGASGRPLAVS